MDYKLPTERELWPVREHGRRLFARPRDLRCHFRAVTFLGALQTTKGARRAFAPLWDEREREREDVQLKSSVLLTSREKVNKPPLEDRKFNASHRAWFTCQVF